VARELHDRVAQSLTGMLVDVENFKSEQVDWSDVVRELDLIQGATRQVLASIRQLLHDLRGESVMQVPFVDAVTALAARVQDKTGIRMTVEVGSGWPGRLSGPASLNLYRMLEEALANVRMHSGATNARIMLETRSETELGLVVADDGRGVDTDPSRPVGFGTIGMRERVLLLGGKLDIESANGHGTSVRAVFPRESVIDGESPALPADGRRSA
jgi:signal transduction histidine kinase